MEITVSRRSHFNAAHRLHNPEWDEAKNKEVFGVCNRPNYHGHNYDVIVSVTGAIDPDTGYLIDMKVLKDIIHTEVHEPFDHRNLNEDTEEFVNLNPTAENIAVVIWHKIKKRLPANLKLKITLYETERNFVAYEGN